MIPPVSVSICICVFVKIAYAEELNTDLGSLVDQLSIKSLPFSCGQNEEPEEVVSSIRHKVEAMAATKDVATGQDGGRGHKTPLQDHEDREEATRAVKANKRDRRCDMVCGKVLMRKFENVTGRARLNVSLEENRDK